MSESEMSSTDTDMQDEAVVPPMIPCTLNDHEQALARALSVSEVYGRNGHSAIENPSTDVRSDLENIITNDLKFKGAFYFNKTYTDAPNPVLRLNSLGRIGLPLSEREAKHIAANSRQAPFGMGERTLVDKEVRDTWEMPGAEVFFDNPNWTGFVNGVTNEVCARLGVNTAASKPRVELYKLLLYETGSHFLAHQDSEKVDGMFATIIIILPSTFTGGTVHLSHAGQKAVVNENKDSFFNTTVLAWYTDVVHEIKPITSGYRLALSYNLVHTTKSLRPALTDTSEPIAKIRRVLLSWRQSLTTEPSTPKKIIYLLEHKYSAANCNGSAMKGKDAHVVAAFDSICSDLGFRIGLALVECYVMEEEGQWKEEDYTRRMKITELVSLDGVRLKEKLELEEKNTRTNAAESIPPDLRAKMERANADQVEEEGYRGNEADTYHRWYRRTVLVWWPEELDEEVLDGKIYLHHATTILAHTTSVKPTASEMRLFQYCLRKKVKDLSEKEKLNVPRSLCTAACRWNEPELWTKAMSTLLGYESVNTLGKEQYLEAVLSFPLDFILPQISKVLEKEKKNKSRLELLQFLESQLRAKTMSTDWVAEAWNVVINSLRPLSGDDVTPLLEACRDKGGAILLEKTILPQLRSGHMPEPLVKLSATIFEKTQSSEASIFQSKDDKAIGTLLVKELLKASIECADLFEGVYKRQKLTKKKIEEYKRDARSWTPHYVNPDLTMSLIRTCLTTRNEDLIDDLVTKLTCKDFDSPILGPENRAKGVLFPLVKQVQELVKDRKASGSVPSGIRRLYREVPPLMLAKKELREEDIATILQVAADDETPEVILQSIIPKLQSLPKLRRVLIRQLVVVGREKPSLEEPLRSTVSELVRQEIDSLESTQWDPSKIIHLLDFCADNSNIDCCGALLARVMEGASPAHSYATLEFINSVPRFSSWLAQHEKQPTWGGFPSFFTAIIHPWIQRRLGASRPADPTPQLLPLQQWRCDCRQCTEIRTLITTPDREKSSIYSSGNSQHLQESLVTFASGLLSWDPPTSYVVHIVKDPSFARAQQWPKNQAIALSAIRGISTDESVLLDVFGETNYRAILSALDEPNINHSLPHQPSVSSSSVGNEGGVGSAANPSSGNVPRAELSSPTQPPTKRRRVEDS